MVGSSDQDAMADRRHLQVVLDIVVGPGGRFVYGTVIDVDLGIQGRFADWPELCTRMREWLSRWRLDHEAAVPGTGDD